MRGDFRLHVEVARERGGRKIFDAVLDPFHRTAGHDRRHNRADVARIGADLVTEATADVGRDHVDLVLGIFEISEPTVRMTCGAWNVPHNVSSPLILSNEATHWHGLERTGMHARIDDHLLDGHVRFREGRVGRSLVASLPIEDVVVVLARAVGAFLLVLDVLADHRRVGGHRFERIDIALATPRIRLRPARRRPPAVYRSSAMTKATSWFWNSDLAVGQHHLHVAGKRRHPGEVRRS